MTWAFLVRHAGMVRHSGMDGTITGLDYVQLFAVADAHGLPKETLAELLPACEIGLLEAITEGKG